MFRDREFKIEQNFLAGPISNTYMLNLFKCIWYTHFYLFDIFSLYPFVVNKTVIFKWNFEMFGTYEENFISSGKCLFLSFGTMSTFVQITFKILIVWIYDRYITLNWVKINYLIDFFDEKCISAIIIWNFVYLNKICNISYIMQSVYF